MAPPTDTQTPRTAPALTPLVNQVKPSRRWPVGWTIVGVAAVVLVGVGVGLNGVFTQQNRTQLLKLTVPATVVDLTQRLRVSGQVQPIRQVNISPRESGRLLELFADQGDVVQQGQLLARMDYGNLSGGLLQAQARITELQARLEQQQAGERSQTIAAAQAKVDSAQLKLDMANREMTQSQAIQSAQARLGSAQSQATVAEAEAERYRKLYEEGATSKTLLDSKTSAWDQAKATLLTAQSDLVTAQTQTQSNRSSRDQAAADLRAAQQDLQKLQAGTRSEDIRQTQAQIEQAKGQLIQQQARIQDTGIRAPFSGVVTQRFASVGAIVTPTTSASDSTAASSSSVLALAQGIEVRADVPEAQIGTVKIGQQVELRSISFPDQVITGSVEKIAPATVVVRDVTVFRVTIKPTGSKADQLRIGMNVSVDFVGEKKPQALTVPAVAILYQNQTQGVILWDVKAQQPIYRQVKTGITQEGVTQILTGLQAGDEVFTSLPPGKTIKDFTGESTTANF